jgi:hypothetical protein
MSSNVAVSKETRRAPKVASLPSLHKVLASFYQSFWATGLVIRSYTEILDAVLDENIQLATQDDAYKAQYWHDLLEHIRDPNSKDFRDPESLQVAQVLARHKPDEIVKELAAGSKYMHGPIMEQWKNKGEYYSTVFRGHKWLYDIARRGAQKLSIAEKGSILRSLSFLDASQPMYTLPELHYLTPEDPKIFGQDGVIMPALQRLSFITPISGGMLYLIEKVLQQAKNVTGVWQRMTDKYGRDTAEVEYRYYFCSLMQVRHKFIEHFGHPSTLSNGQHVSFKMRDILKDIPFIPLWNALWLKAKSRALGPARSKHSLSKWVLKAFALAIKQLGIDPKDIITVAAKASFPLEIDYKAISKATQYSRLALAWGCKWAHGLYPSESLEALQVFEAERESQQMPDGDGDIILGDAMSNPYDLSHLEAHGAYIDVKDYAEMASNPPEGQNCGICVEDYSGGEDDCVRISACGHFFHHNCINAWMNSVLANSNTCPECRAVICVERREIRAKE